MRNVRQMRCIIAIGRPLGEVIKMRIESSTLNCKAKEYLAFYDRLILIRKCEKMAGSEVTSRTNVLLVRQGRLGSGNGVLLTYNESVTAPEHKQLYCDIQLFGPFGIIENPTKSSSSGSQTCRVFINAPPSRRIKIQALSMFNATSTHSTYVLIRDVDTLKTTMFKGHQLFLWISSGSRAEVEFHGEYQQIKGTFQAEYSFANS
uniref:CUB domain-containing protein n=1 Tax=Denticeps clupeoides TaxID=299321 RepID=A0AAY4EV57_9TELE